MKTEEGRVIGVQEVARRAEQELEQEVIGKGRGQMQRALIRKNGLPQAVPDAKLDSPYCFAILLSGLEIGQGLSNVINR